MQFVMTKKKIMDNRGKILTTTLVIVMLQNRSLRKENAQALTHLKNLIEDNEQLIAIIEDANLYGSVFNKIFGPQAYKS